MSGRRDVGDDGRRPRKLVEAVDGEREAGAARDRDQMDDGVGRSAEGEHRGDGVVEGGGRENRAARPPHRVDDAATASARHPRVAESTARIDDAPGSVKPRAPRLPVMVEAVPIVMQ